MEPIVAERPPTAAAGRGDAVRLADTAGPGYRPRHDAERLIAAGRLVLVLLLLLAARLAVARPSPATAVLVGAYAIYAAVLGAFAGRAQSLTWRFRIATHALDLAFLSSLPFLTGPLASPYLAYFVFVTIVASVRWQLRGALWTAVAALVSFVAIAVRVAQPTRVPAFDPEWLAVPAVSLAALAGLVYLGMQRERRLRLAVAAEERARLSRDLHDGVLQALTGAALQIETVQRLWDTKPRVARERLAAIQRLIADEQRNLRVLIRESRLAPVDFPSGGVDVSDRLHALVRRHVELWDQRVELRVQVAGGAMSDAAAADLCRIVQEALVNAARHAAASLVRVSVEEAEGEVRVVVTDDGRGFSFHGDYDHARLAALRLGPVALKERVASLGGNLAIKSTPAGSRLVIRLPRPRAVA